MSDSYIYDPFIELVLYDELDVTGAIDVSLDSDVGPWTTVRLTSPKGVAAALIEWATLAGAALSETFDWNLNSSGGGGPISVRLQGSAEFWVQMSPTLAELLGFSTVVVHGPSAFGSYGVDSDIDMLGAIVPRAIGRTQPRTEETVEVDEFRMGRAVALPHSRRREVTIELFLAEADAETLLRSPIVSGHAQFYCVVEATLSEEFAYIPEQEYGEDNLGGRLLLSPIETPSIDASEGSGNEVIVSLLCVLEGG